MILDDDAAQLGHLGMARDARLIAETVLADAHTGMQQDTVADQAVTECDLRTDPTVLA